MLNSKKLASLSFFFIVLFIVSGTGFSADSKVVKVGYIPIGDCLQLYVAQDMGYFAEEGITVEQKPMKGGAVIAPAVESGEVHIGWSNAISVIIASTKGFDFGFLTSGALSIEGTNRVHSLLVSKASSIKKVTDLKDKKVAINTLGNINELSIVDLASQNGMNVKDFKLVEVPFPNMEVALTSNSVDAILAVEPFVTLSVAHDAATILVESIHKCYGERFMIGSWFAKKSWAMRNPEISAAFTRAINKASEFVQSNPDKIAQILVSNTKLTAGLIEKITLPVFAPEFDLNDLQQMIDLSAKHKFIDKEFSAEQIKIDLPTNN